MSKGDDGKKGSRHLTPTERRIVDVAADVMMEDPKEILFQHSALCQAYLPYRDPKDAGHWERVNGNVTLVVESGRIIDPATQKSVAAGLPHGAKARLIFAHLNSRALKAGSNIIPLEEETFTQFVKSMQDPLRNKAVAPNGREIRAYKEQLKRFSVARFTIGIRDGNRMTQRSPQIIEELDVIWERRENQRLLWPESITLSQAYWESLQRHAVPLDSRALAALAHNALALDIYQWLAQRLHRIPEAGEVVLPRALLYAQFGEGYNRERNFWNRGFLPALRQVLTLYSEARVYVDDAGLHMANSLPPVRKKLHVVAGSTVPALSVQSGESED